MEGDGAGSPNSPESFLIDCDSITVGPGQDREASFRTQKRFVRNMMAELD